MFQVFRNAWRVQDLRKKILFTLFMLLIFRLGSAIPVPFINTALLSEYFNEAFSNTIFGMVNMMSGGAFASATIFALSIQPYINASIIMNLLTVGIPALERMVKEGGEEGRKKIASITRIVTVGLGILQGWGYYTVIARQYGILQNESFFAAAVIILSFTAGTAFIMWLGEQITEFGIGNGISIILFTSIVSRVPTAIPAGIQMFQVGQAHFVILAVIIAAVLVGFIVFITQAERRIPVQYAKRMVGRKMYGGQSSHLPLKVNMSGVMPIIFAQSIASFPATIMAFFAAPATGSFWAKFQEAFSHTSLLYAGIYFILIIGFGYFYTAIQFNPVEIANNLKSNGGFIPGFRPGRPTSDFIRKVLGKITLFGSLFLGIIATLPILLGVFIPGVANTGIALGGTSILIVVGVALETMKQMEAQMMMRHYKGFLE